MPIEWTGLGPELFLTMDRDLPESLGLQLQAQLREAIRAGRLSAGERLPSSRNLATELGISRGLVVDCFQQLEAEGYLTTRGGSATRVASEAIAPFPSPSRRPEESPLDVDFRPHVPDLTSFPMRAWMRALGDVGREAPMSAVGYGDPQGALVLREVLAAYLRRVRGGAAEPEHLVICNGFAQGINLVFSVLSASGIGQVALEDPGDRDNDAAARRAGLDPVYVPVDEGGLDVQALAETSSRAVVLTPAHQTPTGVALAPERRQQLVAWARRHDGIIIEDDYDAELRYDRQPVGSLQGLAPEIVIALGSTSKTLAPALRMGWIVGPPTMVQAIAAEKMLADRGSPGIEQLALAKLIESGRFDQHLRRMRLVYSARRTALVRALAIHAEDVQLGGLAAGFHAVVHLRNGSSEREVVVNALSRSIGLYGMSDYRSSGDTNPAALILGFGNLTESSIAKGISVIGDLLGA